jgi:medium-chain acyl-[acyl-carrier-protein] hydrolase
MNAVHLHRRDFRLRYDDVDRRELAKPVTILNLLEETASSHCDESGWDVFRLMREGFGWVLLRGGFEMRRYPLYREKVAVETWLSSAQRFKAEREYRIYSASGASSGELIGTARSLWLFFDTARKRPASIFDGILDCWTPGDDPASALPLDEIEGPSPDAPGLEVPGQGGAGRDFAVRAADIDTNGHVNNVVYLGWALESLPAELRENSVLSRIQGQFKRELRFGSLVQPRMESEAANSYRLGVFGGPAAPSPASPAAPEEAPRDAATEGSGGFLAAAATTSWTPLAAG